MPHEGAPSLSQLQRTLMRALHGPAGSASQRAAERAARWVAPRAHAAPAPALALYRRMGALRFEREVAREFPALRALLGDARFAELARAFVAQRRSRSFTLEGYAATLPRFVAGARRRALGPAREHAAALAIARLELALGRARGFVPGTNPAIAAGDSCLAPIPAPGAQLLDLAWDAPAAYVAWQRSGARPRAAKRRTRVVVFARDGRAAWLALAAREAELLASLLRGARLERAVARAARRGLGALRIRAAFEHWVASGLLCAGAGFVPGTEARDSCLARIPGAWHESPLAARSSQTLNRYSRRVSTPSREIPW